MIDIRTGEFRFVAAQAVLLATGGGPTMYRYHTPSGDKSMDGLAMALRVGLRCATWRWFSSIPPACLPDRDTRMTGTVLEEGLRGWVAISSMAPSGDLWRAYDPTLERATRDVVSRAIYAEMKAGRTTPNGGVYINMSHLGPARVAKEFKGMVDRCRDCGFDLAGGLVEVVPTAHYFMGGVICRVDTSTDWPRLFVAGEDASGMHGANRLGGNGVANSTVFGGIAGDVMPPGSPPIQAVARAGRGRARCGDCPRAASLHAKRRRLERLREKLFDTMWDDVGVMRDRAGTRPGLANARLDRDRAAGNGHRPDERPGVQSQLARLAQSSLPLRDKPCHCARGQASREFPRRAFPLRFSRSRRSGDLAITVARQVGGTIEIGEQPVEFTHVQARRRPAREQSRGRIGQRHHDPAPALKASPKT